jgi:hypothetical protein
MSELPEWPEIPDPFYADNCFPPNAQKQIGYERARAEAAMARLRICEAVLQDVRVNAHTLEDAIGYATEALKAIGEIPRE